MIRPIDLADNLSKTPYADRVNQVQRRQPETDQQTFHLHLLEKAAEEQSKPRRAEEEERVRNEREKKENSAEENEGRTDEETRPEEGDEDREEGPLGQTVDVLV